MTSPNIDVTEQKRLNDAREKQVPWKKWRPYLLTPDLPWAAPGRR